MKKKSFLKCICLNKNPQVRELDYSSSYLRQVPQEIFNHERTLERLSLDNNNISELTKELFWCKALKELILSDNELCQLPDAIDQLTHLNTLNVSKNNLPELPERIGNCSQLTSLDASGNVFEKLPEAICRLTMLQELVVNTAFLNTLPQNIGRLVNLRHLEVRENEIKSLPSNISSLSNLQYLDVGNNELTDLPDSICRLTKLTVLTADKNNIVSLPEKIGACISLQVLELQQNSLTVLPDSISLCVFLTELVVSENKLSNLPPSIGNLVRLRNLRIDHNQISSLPETIGQLESLVQMYISGNQISHIPHSIGLLRRLRDLHADSNGIVDIPTEIGSCSSLTILSLRGNKIQYLPDEIGRIPRLKMLNLSNNRVKFLPISFLKLRELQAVWLNDNQIQPLVQLQSERDVDTGRKCLVCYLLPQMSNTEDPDAMDNDPNAWQLAQDSRPRVVQWHDETTVDNGNTQVQAKSKLPKDAPAKQVNSKHTLVRQNKPIVTVSSQPMVLSNGDCIMVNACTIPQSGQTPQNVMMITPPMWNNGNASMNQFYPSMNGGSNGGMSKPGMRRMGGGYESDTAAMHTTRPWGRHGGNHHQMMSPLQDGRLAQIRENTESGSRGNIMPGVGAMYTRQGGPSSMGGGGGLVGVGYGRHPAGGGMVGGRQSGYNTDTGPMMGSGGSMSGRSNGQRQVRHRTVQNKQTHYKNPFDQLRVLRSSDQHLSTTSSLPPPPSRQPPPPQRPLPTPPFTDEHLFSMMAATNSSGGGGSAIMNWQLQMAPPGGLLADGAGDPRTANMIIPPPPGRSPPVLAPSTIATTGSISTPCTYHNPSSSVNNYLSHMTIHNGQQPPHPPIITPSITTTNTSDKYIGHQYPAIDPNQLLSRPMFVPLAVMIVRDHRGLGFTITGGVSSNPNSFRPDDKGMFIAKVNQGGAADGRLKVGDKILVVNNVSMIGIEHSAAVTILKSCGEVVHMTVERLVDRAMMDL